jgi:divalent metal cation (Fe/Co/Zn/Cd) transporter
MARPTIALASSPVWRERGQAVRTGVRIEVITIVWMVIEAAIAIGAGILARSVLLTAFGVDSVIELGAGGVLLWRLLTEARGGLLERVERAENRAAWITGGGLALLCAYVVASAALGLLGHNKAEASTVGIALSVAAVVGMPILAWRKRAIAARINSAALRGDAACSITCAYMAGALLVGLALNAAFRWWWVDSVTALALLYWLIPEARQALEGARAGRGGCGCGDGACGA